MRHRVQALTAATVLLLGGVVAGGGTGVTAATACDTWTGAVSTSWATAGNWSSGVPTSGVAACIPGSSKSGFNVQISGAATAASVSIGAGSQLDVGSESSLSTMGDVSVSGVLAFSDDTGVVSAPVVDVRSGGALVGVGQVRGDVNNAGAVDVIDSGSGVPLRVSDHYTQLRSASVLFRDEGGAFSHLDAGSASLAGRFGLLILDALTPGARYVIVEAGSMSGHFDAAPGYRIRYHKGTVTVVVHPQVQVRPSPAAPGALLRVSGESFGYEGTVELHLDSTANPPFGACNVTSVGSFECRVRLPRGTSAGDHRLIAVNTAYGYRALRHLAVS